MDIGRHARRRIAILYFTINANTAEVININIIMQI